MTIQKRLYQFCRLAVPSIIGLLLFGLLAACGGGGGGSSFSPGASTESPTPPPSNERRTSVFSLAEAPIDCVVTPDGDRCIDLSKRYCADQNMELDSVGKVCKPYVVTDCQARGQILDGESCRDLSQEECLTNPELAGCKLTKKQCETRLGQVLTDSNTCRKITSADCEAQDKILDGTSCRQITTADCAADGQVLSSGGTTCRAPQVAAECNARDQILSGNQCESCSGDTPARHGNQCGQLAATCLANGQILKDALCGAPTTQECFDRGEVLEGSRCQIASVEACNSHTDKGEIAPGLCRSITQQECAKTDGKAFVDNQCISCGGTTPVSYGNVCGPSSEMCIAQSKLIDRSSGTCRLWKIADCQSAQLLKTDKSGCRAVEASDCQIDNEVFANSVCRKVVDSDCAAMEKVLDSGRCRFLTEKDCESNEFFEQGQCQALTAAQCSKQDKVLSSGVCESCTGNLPVRYDSVCGPSSEMCEGRFQVLQGTTCGAPTLQECESRSQKLNKESTACRYASIDECKLLGETLNSARTACRVLVAGDCLALNQVWDSTNRQCRPRTEADCSALSQKLDSAKGTCRAWTTADCHATNKIFSHGACQLCSDSTPARYGNVCGPTADMCTAQNKALRGSACGAPTISECITRSQILSGGVCRNLQVADCEAVGKTLSINGESCRVLTETDCAPNQKLDSHLGTCRAWTVADCAQGQVLGSNGLCRNQQSSDCTGNEEWKAATTLCIAQSPESCENDERWDGSQCRSLTHADCAAQNQVRQTDGSCGACAADAPVPFEGRACVPSAQTCLAQNQILSSGHGQPACRALTTADCVSQGQILDSNSCRAIQSADCSDTQTFDHGACRALVPHDCQPHQETWSGSRCVAVTEYDCHVQDRVLDHGSCQVCQGNGEQRYGNVCGPTTDSCVAQGKVLATTTIASDSPQCRVRTSAECTDSERWTGSACLALAESDCTVTQKWTGSTCRALAASDCAVTEMWTGTTCRQVQTADCHQANKILSGNSCVSCGGNTPARYGNTCGPSATVCATSNKLLEVSHGGAAAVCVAYTKSDCLRLHKGYDEVNRICRASTAEDCLATQTFEHGACRALAATDCSNTQEFDNGACRAREASDCLEVEKIDNGICRAFVAADCSATQVFESSTCRARVASDCSSSESLISGVCLAQAASCPDGQIVDETTRTCRDKKVIADCLWGEVPDSNAEGGCRAFVTVEKNKDCPADKPYSRVSRESGYHPKTHKTCYADQEVANSWHNMEWTSALGAHEKGYRGQGVTVGIIGDGIDGSTRYGWYQSGFIHEDLRDNYVGTVSVRVNNNGVRMKEVAMIAAPDNGKGGLGIAPEAKITFLSAESRNYYKTQSRYGNPIVKDSPSHAMRKIVNAGVSIVVMDDGFLNESTRHFLDMDSEELTSKFECSISFSNEDINDIKEYWFNRQNPESSSSNEISAGDYHIRSTENRNFFFLWDKEYRKDPRGGKGSVSIKQIAADIYGSFTDTDTVFVWESGANADWLGFNFHLSDEETSGASSSLTVGIPYALLLDKFMDSKNGEWSTLNVITSMDDVDALVPLMVPGLRDNWLVGSDHAWGGCLEAKDWCVTVPRSLDYFTGLGGLYGPLDDRYDDFFHGESGHYSLGGALAVLKSAAPSLPMKVVKRILLRTATDMGEEGVDRIYGHGLLNISAGITHIESIRTAGPSGVKLSELELSLPAEFGYLANRLESAEIAVDVIDGAYYNMPLSRVAKVSADDSSLTDATRELNNLGLATSEYVENKHTAMPFFARNGGVLLQTKAEGLRPFAAFDANGDLKESAYQQLGFRYQKTMEGFGLVAELSHIREKDRFWGSDFSALSSGGKGLSGRTEQAKLLLSGDLAKQWRGFAGYEHARARAAALSGEGIIRGIEGATADGWTAGLERGNLWVSDDKLRFSARRETGARGGHLVVEAPYSEGGGFGETARGEAEQNLVTRRTLIPLRKDEAWIWSLGYSARQNNNEWLAALEYDEEKNEAAWSAKWQFDF